MSANPKENLVIDSPCLGAAEKRSVLRFRNAKEIAKGAEIMKKSLFVSQDLGLFCRSDELDHVALLGDTLFKHERIKGDWHSERLQCLRSSCSERRTSDAAW